MANAPFSPTRESPVGTKLDLRSDAQGGHHAGERGEAQLAPILVLSRYSALIETVRRAAPRGVPVVPSPDVEQASVKMRSLKPGVLVIDTASTADMVAMVAQLTAQFPTLVIVAAGQRDDSAALMQLTASGQIFRFLLVPLSHGQTRLTLDAAIAEHQKVIAAAPQMMARKSPDEAAKKRDVTGYIAFGIGLAISLAGIVWFLSRTPSDVQAPVAATEPATAPATSAVVSQPEPLQVELDRAQEAFDRGQYLEPSGKSALDYYRSALNIDSDSGAAKAGIRRVADKILERADAALTAQRIEAAAEAIETARGIDPQHPRLIFLDGQVVAERTKLSQQQDTRRRINALVLTAQELTKQGRLVAPKDRSALDALLEARRLDPTNPEVTQGLRNLSQALAEEANRLIKAGNLDAAQSLLSNAQSMGVEGASLAAVQSALTDTRNRAAAANRQPPPTPLVKTSPTPATVPSAGASPSKGLAAQPRPAPSEGKPTDDPKNGTTQDKTVASRGPDPVRAAPNQPASVARDAGPARSDAAAGQAGRELAARPAASAASDIMPASQLRRVRTVEPVYPIAARRRKEEGMVEVVFTVTPDGNVENVEVRQSIPELVFDEAAKKAVEQWRFEPVEVNGQAVSQRASARLRFSLD